ncbi:MAG: hypothetical protein PHE68_00340 [Candidatus Peribacteraceae bacterium]|nr:hypothetical protein [Candidatus Peribacteraceae bacterium]MDD5074445.1 hypothetical protein [Candidatus Peribacteraceae bacterium]
MREADGIITVKIDPNGVTDVKIEQALQEGGIGRMAVTTPEDKAEGIRAVHVRRESDETARQVMQILKGIGATIVA